MSVIVSPLAGTTLGTASGFLKAEVYNLGTYSTTNSAVLSTPLDIGATFTTGSRNNAGVILCPTSTAAGIDRNLRVSLQQIMGSCTISIANPAVVTFNSHGFSDGQPVQFSATTLPIFNPVSTYGATVGTVSMIFFAGNVATNTFNLYDTSAHAIAGGSTGRVITTGTATSVILYADRGVSEQTASNIYNGSANHFTDCYLPCAWTGYGIDTTAAKWRFHVFQYGGTTGNFTLKKSDASNPFFCEISSITATATNNDTLVCYGPVTVNTDFTAKGTLGTGDTIYAPAIIICKSATDLTSISFNENLVWDGSAAHTLTINGLMTFAFQSGFRAGSSVSRITNANMGTINFVAPTVGTKSGIYHTETDIQGGYCGRGGIFIYGERPGDRTPSELERTTFTGNINAGDSSLTSTDTTGWSINDRIVIGRLTNTKTQTDNTYYTITGITGTAISFSPVIPANKQRTSGGMLFRLNGYGFKITGVSSSSVTVVSPKNSSFLILDGVELSYFGTPLNYGLWGNNVLTDDNGTVLITHCSLFGNVGTSLLTGYVPSWGITISYCNTQYQNICTVLWVNYAASGVLTFDHNFVSCNNTLQVYISNFAIATNNVFEGGNGTGGHLLVSGYNYTVTNNKFWGAGASSSSTGCIIFGQTLSPLLWSGNSYDNSVSAIYMGSNGVYNAGPFDTDSFGQLAVNTWDFTFYTYLNYQATFTNSVGTPLIHLGTPGTSSGIRNNLTPTFLRFKNYNNTVNDYRSWNKQGRYYNPSQNETICQTSYGSVEALVNKYYIATGAISTYKMALCITGMMSNAGYYGGSVYSFPNVKAVYDVTSDANQDLVANTNAQSFVILFTPSTDYSDIVINLTTLSDACNTDTNSTCGLTSVTWSNCSVKIRKYGYVFGDYTITIKQTTDSYLASVSQPVSNPYITEAIQATVDAYTGISINHGTQTMTIAENHALSEIYDYAQSNLTADENMGVDEWFTVSGGGYASLYAIVLNGCHLTGQGSINISEKTFTRSDGGTYDGIVIHADGSREVHVLLNNLNSGSTVRIYNNDTSTELYNGLVSGTTLDHIFTWTMDNELEITVTKAGSPTATYVGDVTKIGLSLTLFTTSGVTTLSLTDGINFS